MFLIYPLLQVQAYTGVSANSENYERGWLRTDQQLDFALTARLI